MCRSLGLLGLRPTPGLSTSIAALNSRTRPVFVRGWGSLFIILGTLLIAGPALANDFTVNLTLDGTDVNPGNGVCDSIIGCTLRAAIQEANALGGAHTITLPAGSYGLTIPGAGDGGGLNAAIGDLDVVGTKVTIYGSGANVTSISGNHLSRLFHVFTDAQLELCDLALINGSSGTSGGGILNLGSLTVTNSRIEENAAPDSGGGIANIAGGSLSVVNSMILANTAAGGGGGILNNGEATISRTEISGNSSGSGGGIINVPGATLTLIDSSVRQNIANVGPQDSGTGGGIVNTGNADLIRSTVAGNHAHVAGGFSNGGGFGVSNSTISDNHADLACSSPDPCPAGGILNSASGLLVITNTTIVENEGDLAGGILNQGIASVGNSIVAHNIGGNCAPVTGQTATTAITSNGYNMEDVDDCAFTAIGDQVNTPPLLGPLQDNGGPTQTHALLPTSPAIDTAVGCPLGDQRGFFRPVPCDIGSYEKGILPDLALTMRAYCERVLTGGRLGFTIVATNFGDAEDSAVQVSDPLPEGMEVTLVQTSQGRCITIDDGTGMVEVNCDLGSLPPDGSAHVTIETVATRAGEFDNVANVTGSLPDTNPDNNFALAMVTVGPQCGDGTLDSGEECDDGNTLPGDGCNATCVQEFCGDTLVQAALGEECDDGNTRVGDGCDELCRQEVCGNGVLQIGEECDDGNTRVGDGCDELCRQEVCGNGVLQIGEGCDDGNTTPGDGCDELCRQEVCGNGVLQIGEECDDGNNDDGDCCSSGCRVEEPGGGDVMHLRSLPYTPGSNTVSFEWDLNPLAAAYEVHRGTFSVTKQVGVPYDHTLSLTCNSPGPPESDSDSLSPGGGFYFLVRSINACGKGILGLDSDSIPRPDLAACP